jgi:hypothetical protein
MMMKRLNVVLASFAAMLTLGTVNSASAMDAAGYGPCYLESQSLMKSGFSEGQTYTPAEIAQFTKRDGVTVNGLNKLHPPHRYKVAYTCRVDHGMVRNYIVASMIHRNKAEVNVIHWEVTGPLTENTMHVPL